MAFFFRPGQFSSRAHFHYQLAQLLAAGVTLPSALAQLEQHPPSRSYLAPIRQLRVDLQSGFTFSEALLRQGWFSDFDLAMIRAGEQSGRLDESFRLLAGYYSDRARMARQLWADLAYPVALLHLAVFIFPFPAFFLYGDWRLYLLQTFGVLVPLYVIVAVVVFASQGHHGEGWRAWIERFTNSVPILGRARKDLALGRLCAALAGLLRSGVSIVEAWELAGAASGSPVLNRTIKRWRPALDAGSTPAEVVNASGRFPDLFTGQYMAGEVSGTLEETLDRLHGYYQEEGSRKMHALAQWTPRVIYLAIALMIGYRIVSFYAGYFRQIQDAMEW